MTLKSNKTQATLEGGKKKNTPSLKLRQHLCTQEDKGLKCSCFILFSSYATGVILKIHFFNQNIYPGGTFSYKKHAV
jgi:hypothetical protein